MIFLNLLFLCQNYLLMTLLFFLLFVTSQGLARIWIKIFFLLKIGLFNGKWLSTRILINRLQRLFFPTKRKPDKHPSLYFNGVSVACSSIQKHLGLVLDEKLTFDHHLNEKISKAIKGISLIKKLHKYLPRKSLLCIYKSFVRSHLDYADIIYDQPQNNAFSNKIQSVQYNAALAITGAIRGSSRERLYEELGLESLGERRWYHKLVYFFNIALGNSPRTLLPLKQCSYDQARSNIFRTFKTNTEYFKNSFFPYCVNEWNKSGPESKNSLSISKFKKGLLVFIRPKASLVYNIHNPLGLKLLTRLRVNFSHLENISFGTIFLIP